VPATGVVRLFGGLGLGGHVFGGGFLDLFGGFGTSTGSRCADFLVTECRLHLLSESSVKS